MRFSRTIIKKHPLLTRSAIFCLIVAVVGTFYLYSPKEVASAEIEAFITAGTTWDVPADWNDEDNSIEVIGAGGGGGGGGVAVGGEAGGGGGAGGAYAIASNVDMPEGTTVTVSVGTAGTGGAVQTSGTGGGDTFVCNSTSNCADINGTAVVAGAKGGPGGVGDGLTTIGGAGGTAPASGSSVGDTVNVGGNGAAGGDQSGNAKGGGGGGGAGGAGGPNGAGGAGAAGGVANSGGVGGAGGNGDNGSGGAGGAADTAGGNGTEWSASPDRGSGGGGGGGTGGGNNSAGLIGGAGGTYGAGGAGGGGGGDGGAAAAGADGTEGLIRIVYTPPPSITVSGTLYLGEGVNEDTAGGRTINLMVGTSTPSIHSTTTASGSGAWSIGLPSTTTPGLPLAVWVDGDPNMRAFTLTKASTSADGANITGLDLYQDHIIVRHEGTSGTSTTITDLNTYDGDDNSSIQYTSDGSSLTVKKDQKLYVWGGDTFAPGGAVTVHANASSTSETDGSIHIANGATFTSGGDISLGGNFIASSTATFTHGGFDLIFTATTTGKRIAGNVVGSNNIGSTTFDGAGGAWTFSDNASTTEFSIRNGSVTAPAQLTVAGDFRQNGSFTHGGGTLFMDNAGAQLLTGALTDTNALNNVTFAGSGTKTLGVNASTTDVTVSGGTLDLSGRSVTIGGNLANSSTLTTSAASRLYFTGTSKTLSGTLSGTSALGTVEFLNSGSWDIQANASTSDFTVTSGTVTTPNSTTISGDFTQNGTLTADATDTLYFTGTSKALSGTLSGSSALGNVEFLNSGSWDIQANASTTDFTVTSGTVTAPTLLTVSGDYTNNGTLTAGGSGTVYFASGSAQSIAGTLTGSSAFNDLVFLLGGTKTFSNNASTTDMTISGGTVVAPPTLTIEGDYTNTATFNANSGTTIISGSAQQTLSGTMTGTSAFADLEILNDSGTDAQTDPGVIFAAGASTTETFTVVTPNTKLRFTSGATSTFTNINFAGADSNLISLRSSSAGTPSGIVVTGTQSVTYTDVADSYACGGDDIVAEGGTNVNGGGTSCWVFNDPPTPDPMTFATAPDDASVSSITMTATAATDDSTPVEYSFDNVACSQDGGTGGTDSGWQSETNYTDTGLETNQCYEYTVTARDAHGNTGTASAAQNAYTAANVPGAPSLEATGASTVVITNDANSNPASNPTTEFAVQIVTTTPSDPTWLNQYVDGNGDPSASEVWLSDSQIDDLTIQGLTAETLYGVQVKARNADGDETALGGEGQTTTFGLVGPYNTRLQGVRLQGVRVQ